ncbi:hypothetical protein PoB_005488500 [Plakobranchus ocellatus]|uniref:Uncharacterized protein n=1 Tax=Plakobranchus ocellatus TaxID=259542 RepID=A0AAV4CAD6_9GAST|nr:hypothetical protein PoB_005488500 [Plakobranchus ocellatus]
MAERKDEREKEVGMRGSIRGEIKHEKLESKESRRKRRGGVSHLRRAKGKVKEMKMTKEKWFGETDVTEVACERDQAKRLRLCDKPDYTERMVPLPAEYPL